MPIETDTMSKPIITTRPSHTGFTLLELMITLSILSILAAIGVSGFSRLLDSTQNRKTTDSLRASIAQSRSESITRGGNVRFCGSTNGTSCTNSFDGGWLIYHDSNADNKLSNADTVLTWHAQDYRGLTIAGVNSSGIATTDFGFNYRGYPTQAMVLAVNARTVSKTVQLHANGRVEIQ